VIVIVNALYIFVRLLNSYLGAYCDHISQSAPCQELEVPLVSRMYVPGKPSCMSLAAPMLPELIVYKSGVYRITKPTLLRSPVTEYTLHSCCFAALYLNFLLPNDIQYLLHISLSYMIKINQSSLRYVLYVHTHPHPVILSVRCKCKVCGMADLTQYQGL
jgi:hypothetical protein